MMKKRLITLMLAGAMALSLAACGSNETEDTAADAQTEENAAAIASIFGKEEELCREEGLFRQEGRGSADRRLTAAMQKCTIDSENEGGNAMFREMRRKKQKLSMEECAEILYRGTSGVLALAGDDDYPYAVPISYVYDGRKIYFHCAKSGHKLDAIGRNPKASFCVIDQDQIVPEEYTTYFRSVIVFGTIRILENMEEKWNAVEKLALKYAPDDTAENRKRAIEREWKPLCVLEMEVEHISGKEAIELMRRRPDSCTEELGTQSPKTTR